MSLEQAINNLAAAINNLAGADGPVKTSGRVQTEDEAPSDPPQEETQEAETEVAAKDDPFAGLVVDPDIEYKMSDLRKSLAQLVDAEGESVAIEVLSLFGAKKLSQIKEEDYGKFCAYIERKLK